MKLLALYAGEEDGEKPSRRRDAPLNFICQYAPPAPDIGVSLIQTGWRKRSSMVTFRQAGQRAAFRHAKDSFCHVVGSAIQGNI